MDSEIARLRPANTQTLVMQIPQPIGEETLRAKTEKQVLRRLARLERRGYIHSASPIARFHRRAGGGYGVKVRILKPLPEPMPGWAKGAALVGSVLAVLGMVSVLVLNAIASVFAKAQALPWAQILVVGALAALILGGTKTGRRCCTIVVNVWHH